TVIAPNDPSWDRLTTQAKKAQEHPQAWLEMTDIYGELAGNTAFINAFSRSLTTLWEIGTPATLKRYLAAAL
ncbi:mannitol dehydrogenase family protein, partial [Devosia sp. PTR5]|nr:mannitol dehydrogenase family protein [Devosia oryzisoli]